MKAALLPLTDRPELLDTAAQWFHEKWGVPRAAYAASMEDCLRGEHAVPRWYLALEGDTILGGLGVIDNDFHDRKDLAPNVCALYTEAEQRGRGLAGALLRYAWRGHEGPRNRHPVSGDRPHHLLRALRMGIPLYGPKRGGARVPLAVRPQIRIATPDNKNPFRGGRFCRPERGFSMFHRTQAPLTGT